jgi:hypothetical protein
MRDGAKLLLSVVLVGCTSHVDEFSPDLSLANYILFSPMYSAFDGKHDYAVTPSVPGAAPSDAADPILASSIKWHLDGAFVRQDEFPELPAATKLTTKNDGVTIVGMTAKTLSGRAIRSETELIISKANQSEWDAGEARYNNGEMSPRMRPQSMCGLVSGIELPETSACSACHNPVNPEITIEHTPTQTAGYSNDDLIQIFTQGAKSYRRGGTYNSPFLRAAPMPDCIYKELHTWEMTDDEKRGIIWKLRSIPPKHHEEL